jgi:hypothetical protein
MSAGAGPRFDREEGAPRDWLRRCEEEGRDGTRLGGCLKLYIPQPAGQWGTVLPATKKLPSRPWC